MLRTPDWERWRALVDTPVPPWVGVRQVFDRPVELAVAQAVRRELDRPEVRAELRPGYSVAIGVGSRGLASLPEIVSAAVEALKDAGCHPIIVPAMGSHGGATAEGQEAMLASLGISEARVGAPVRSSMDVVEIGRLSNGLPIYFDRISLQADLVIPINRIKPHTSFRGPVESGLTKMLAIGFGKHVGATTIHGAGWDSMGRTLSEALALVQARTPFRFGLATVENAYHEVAAVEAVLSSTLPQREEDLLALAGRLMPRLQFDRADVLVVRRFGKDISGAGVDPNVTGRYSTCIRGAIQVNKIVLLNLTPASGGNAAGLGLADVTTERVIRDVHPEETWINVVTSTNLPLARLPVYMRSDLMAVQLALKTCNQPDSQQARVIWIDSTLDLEKIYISPSLLDQVRATPGFEVLSSAEEVPFDGDGNLIWT